MKRGFLLSDTRSPAFSAVLEPIEAEECPICLEALEPEEALMLSCRHCICVECTQSLWEVRRAAQSSTQYLECPLCRELLHVAGANLPAFLAANSLANFGARVRTPRRRAGSPSPSSLDNLTIHELKAVVRLLGSVDVTGVVERADIERAVEASLGAPSPAAAISALPLRCLQAVLGIRDIPHEQCVERDELVKLVLQSPRGSCSALPAGVLKRMLAAFGHGGEITVGLEKHELARRVMVVRALARSGASATAADPPGARRDDGGGTDLCATCATCCTIS